MANHNPTTAKGWHQLARTCAAAGYGHNRLYFAGMATLHSAAAAYGHATAAGWGHSQALATVAALQAKGVAKLQAAQAQL